MPAARAEVTTSVAARLAAGARLALVGERGSGRTTLARRVMPQSGRGTGVRLVADDRFALLTATRGAPSPRLPLLVEDVQWADAETLSALRALPGPLLLTCLPDEPALDELGPLERVDLLPLPDEQAAPLLPAPGGSGGDAAVTGDPAADREPALRRAGGNLRLLTSLTAGRPPTGPAARVLHAMLEPLTAEQRAVALGLAVAVGPLPLDPTHPPTRGLLAAGVVERAAGGLRLRVGALGEVALAGATGDQRAAAHKQAAELSTDALAAGHLLACGDLEGARDRASRALEGARSEAEAADLLLLLEAAGARLPEERADRLASALWRCWRLDPLIARFGEPGTVAQARVTALARAARGQRPGFPLPAGVRARLDLAAGALPQQPRAESPGDEGARTSELPEDAADLDLAAGLAAVATGGRPEQARAVDVEQRWQSQALSAVATALDGSSAGDVDDGSSDDRSSRRWTALTDVLRAALAVSRDGAERAAVDHLAAALDRVPVPCPAWGHAVLAVALSDLGDAGDAEQALAAADRLVTSSLDRQVVALARAECELTTGRPRRALRAVDGVDLWPVLKPYGAVLRGWAARALREAQPDDSAGAGVLRAVVACEAELIALRGGLAEDFERAASSWRGISERRALLCRWAAQDAAVTTGRPDVAELRRLEQEAADRGLLPLLSRVRDTLRRAGERPTRAVGGAAARGALSGREAEVMALVREGLTSAQAATRLGVAQSTVETQVAAAMRKLGARTRRHAVALLDEAVR